MIARRTKDAVLVALGFDLTDSDLVLRVAFPKLFRNALTWLVSGGTAGIDAEGVSGESLSDERISDLNAVPRTPDASSPDPDVSGRVAATGDVWPWLVACALTLTVFEWLSYHRRWTV